MTTTSGAGNGMPRRPRHPPFPHLDDITSVTPDCDPQLPLHKIIEDGASCMRRAKMLASTDRLDLALKEYIKAQVVALDIVTAHREYNSPQFRTRLHSAHMALLRDIKAQQSLFEEAKDKIRSDNQELGIQSSASLPATRPRTLPRPNEHSSTTTTATPETATAPHAPNGHAHGPKYKLTNKPAVHPKPAALQGHAVPKHGEPGVKVDNTDNLLTRFNNLRPSGPRTQDPRIKTHPPIMDIPLPNSSRSNGPVVANKANSVSDPIPANNTNRYSAPAPASAHAPPPSPVPAPTPARVPDLGPETTPGLPKLPAAIYNPARGTVPTGTANLPSSVPRGMFSRSNSVRGTNVASSPNGTLRSPTALSPTSLSPTSGANGRPPERDTVTVSELYSYMRRGATSFQVLVVDVRPRDQYEQGHIMTQSAICIEPVILHDGISADQIAESMVLGPTREADLFERRDKFDVVVLYDQSSTEFPKSSRGGNQALRHLRDALVLYSYDRELRTGPQLLKAGLNSWVDVMGSHSLQTLSDPSTQRADVRHRRYNSTAQPTTAQQLKQSRAASRPRSRTREAPKPRDRMESIDTNGDASNAQSDSFSPVRTTEDFLRRFPDPNSIQESMRSTATPTNDYDDMSIDAFFPPAPARPAPALPRTSYSGLHDDSFASSLMHPNPRMAGQPIPAGRPTLLRNTGNTCYADSALHILLASTAFTSFLTSGSFANLPGAAAKNPKHLCRLLAILFQNLLSGAAVETGATAVGVRKYFGPSGMNAPRFAPGCTQQQCSCDFLYTLLGQLETETNPRADASQAVERKVPYNEAHTDFEAALDSFLKERSKHGTSPIAEFFQIETISSRRCQNGCPPSSRLLHLFWVLERPLRIPEDSNETVLSVERWIEWQLTNPKVVDLPPCGTCKLEVGREPELFTMLPRYLLFHIAVQEGRQEKDPLGFTFHYPVRERLDMSPFVCPRPTGAMGTQVPEEFEGPWEYELYGVSVHVGPDVNTGHYVGYVRDETRQENGWRNWWCLDDTKVAAQAVTLKGRERREVCGEFVKRPLSSPSILAYRRVGRRGPTRGRQMAQI